MLKKFLFGLILFILVSGLSWAQQQITQPWWYSLEQGKQYYRSGAYGDALNAFDNARRGRLAHFSRMEDDMILFLSAPAVRRLGDSLEIIEKYIALHNETRAASAMAELYHRLPKESLKDSAKRALEELDRLKSYPEAEYWLGEIYRAEGELGLSVRQYEKAWKDRALLETPEFDVEILYKLAEVNRIRNELLDMEKWAREIVEGRGPSGKPRDNLWATDNSYQMRIAMTRILENDGVGRFLTLYRHDNTVTEKAHRLLGFYYYSSNRYSRAEEHLMFAFLIQNTVLINDVLRREYDYTFTTLEDLLGHVSSRRELQAFLEETEYYRTVYYLASALYASGRTRPSRELWNFLAGSADAGEWGERARRNPNPNIAR